LVTVERLDKLFDISTGGSGLTAGGMFSAVIANFFFWSRRMTVRLSASRR
jgi:hypothetical protein